MMRQSCSGSLSPGPGLSGGLCSMGEGLRQYNIQHFFHVCCLHLCHLKSASSCRPGMLRLCKNQGLDDGI